MMSAPLLSIRDASKHYGDAHVLIDASLDLMPGTVHALMGENGAGKSTLIRILAGVVAPDSISIRIHGQPVHISDPQAAAAAGLRFIHQELNVIAPLSVGENLFIGRVYPRRLGLLVDWKRLADEARAALARLGISHIDPRIPIARLSVGDQMLVRIASAFITGGSAPLIYVLDEPTAALTGAETARLFSVITELKGQGCAVLYVSHRMEEIFQIADVVTVMRDGRVIETKPAQATDARELIHLMTGRALAQVYPPRTTPIPDRVLLRARDLRSRHVAGIDVDVRAGEILGVAGLTGSGRTELLRAIAGADRVTGGMLELDGVDIRRRGLMQAWRQGIAYVPEERRTQGLMLSRSIRDNITLPHLDALSLGGIFLAPRREARESHALGESVRLRASGVRQTTRELSGGNQQKVLFARSLARKPRLLLLDEPTRGVDVGAKYDLYTLIREMSEQGVSIIMVSSDLGELLGLCDRVLVMRARQQAALVGTDGLSEHDLLTLCYGEDD
jgi:ABC-type sugar transport system ATPase subunit